MKSRRKALLDFVTPPPPIAAPRKSAPSGTKRNTNISQGKVAIYNKYPSAAVCIPKHNTPSSSSIPSSAWVPSVNTTTVGLSSAATGTSSETFVSAQSSPSYITAPAKGTVASQVPQRSVLLDSRTTVTEPLDLKQRGRTSQTALKSPTATIGNKLFVIPPPPPATPKDKNNSLSPLGHGADPPKPSVPAVLPNSPNYISVHRHAPSQLSNTHSKDSLAQAKSSINALLAQQEQRAEAALLAPAGQTTAQINNYTYPFLSQTGFTSTPFSTARKNDDDLYWQGRLSNLLMTTNSKPELNRPISTNSHSNNYYYNNSTSNNHSQRNSGNYTSTAPILTNTPSSGNTQSTVANIIIPASVRSVEVSSKNISSPTLKSLPLPVPNNLQSPLMTNVDISNAAAAARRQRQQVLANLPDSSVQGNNQTKADMPLPSISNISLPPQVPTSTIHYKAGLIETFVPPTPMVSSTSNIKQNSPVTAASVVSSLFKQMAAHGPIDIATFDAVTDLIETAPKEEEQQEVKCSCVERNNVNVTVISTLNEDSKVSSTSTVDAATPQQDKTITKLTSKELLSEIDNLENNSQSLGAATPKRVAARKQIAGSNVRTRAGRKREEVEEEQKRLKEQQSQVQQEMVPLDDLPLRLSFAGDVNQFGATNEEDFDEFDLNSFVKQPVGEEKVDYNTPSRRKKPRTGNAKSSSAVTNKQLNASIPKTSPLPLTSVLCEVLACDRLSQLRRETTTSYLLEQEACSQSMAAMSPTNTMNYNDIDGCFEAHSPLGYRGTYRVFPQFVGNSPVDSACAFSPTVPIPPTATTDSATVAAGQYNPSAEMNLEDMYGGADGAGGAADESSAVRISLSTSFAPPPRLSENNFSKQRRGSFEIVNENSNTFSLLDHSMSVAYFQPSLSQAMLEVVEEDERSLSQTLKFRVDAAVQRARKGQVAYDDCSRLEGSTDNPLLEDTLDKTGNSDLYEAIRSFASVDILFGDDE